MSELDPRAAIQPGFANLPSPATAHSHLARPATRFETHAPLIAATEEKLSVAFAANLFELFRAMSHLPGAEIQEQVQLSRHSAPPFNPMFKGVWQSRLAEHEADEAIGESTAWLKERGAPFAFWWVDPRATPTDLGTRLQAHGFAPWEEHAPGMAADLMSAVCTTSSTLLSTAFRFPNGPGRPGLMPLWPSALSRRRGAAMSGG